jgi:hypothetical protein
MKAARIALEQYGPERFTAGGETAGIARERIPFTGTRTRGADDPLFSRQKVLRRATDPNHFDAFLLRSLPAHGTRPYAGSCPHANNGTMQSQIEARAPDERARAEDREPPRRRGRLE